MYFILSKVLLFLLFPILWFFALAIVAMFTKNAKRKKRLLVASLILLYVFSNSFLFDRVAHAWDYDRYPDKNTDAYSCAIILGGFSSYIGGKGSFNENADRFIQAMKLQVTGKAKYLLISGGNGNLDAGTFKEAEWVKGQLKELKFPDSVVLIENNSRNTIENAVFSKKVLLGSHLRPPYLLVTSAFHMRRSMMIFKKQGIDVVAYPCNYIVAHAPVKFGDFIPNAGALEGWNIYLKEMVGYMVDSWKKNQ
jgi:uncharacterized SAM-binding protein YcdF (DUF218 family)